MKNKVVLVVLAVVSVGLAIALFAIKKQSDDQHAADVNSIVDFSNQVVNASQRITDLNQVNLALTNDLATSRQQAAEFSNNLATTSATLAADQASLADAQGQITNLNSRISDLELQNKTLDQRASELSSNLADLNLVIETTKQKLAKSEAGNAFLQQELQRQMAQRAELEHKFSDLDELRQQVKKIKSDLFVARRLHMMQNSSSQKKGAELLMQRAVTVPAAEAMPSNGLNVEVGSDGSVKVIPPLGAPTNSAAQ